MTLAITQVGAFKQTGPANTDALDTVTSDSATWAVDDLIVVCFGIVENSGAAWTLASTSTSGGATSTQFTQASASTPDSFGYSQRAVIRAMKVTTGFTGTVSAVRTAGTTSHWTTAGFFKVTGQDTTTPIVNAISNNATSGTSQALNLGSAPASTSILVSHIVMDDNATLTLPGTGGWAQVGRLTEGSFGLAVESDNTSTAPAQNNTFTASSGGGGWAGSLVEIVAGGGPPPAPYPGGPLLNKRRI